MENEPKLTRVRRLDSVPLEKAEYTPEGFLIDTPIVTSVGIFEYHDASGTVSRELRLPEHVFAEESLATYEGKPVVITHDAGRVSKDNATEEIVGTILSKGYQDGGDVRVKMIIHDVEAVRQSGLRELSLGYDLVLDETPGEWNGQPYDAIQTEIAINHLAIVREARAGEQARLNIDSKENDDQKGANTMDMPKKTIKKAMNADEMKKSVAAFEARRKQRLDEAEEEKTKADAEPENTDAESEVAEEIKENNVGGCTDKPPLEERVKLIKDRRGRRDADGDPDSPENAKGIIAQQDEDIEELLKMIEELQAARDIAISGKKDDETAPQKEDGDDESEDKPMNADSVDKAVSERLKLVRIGDRLNLDGLETLRPLDAKKRIVKAIKPDLRLDGKGAVYINTAFDIALQELNSRKGTGYQRRQIFNRDGIGGYASQDKSKSQQARDNMLSRMQNGGKE